MDRSGSLAQILQIFSQEMSSAILLSPRQSCMDLPDLPGVRIAQIPGLSVEGDVRQHTVFRMLAFRVVNHTM